MTDPEASGYGAGRERRRSRPSERMDRRHAAGAGTTSSNTGSWRSVVGHPYMSLESAEAGNVAGAGAAAS
jgi:hypothetical protein